LEPLPYEEEEETPTEDIEVIDDEAVSEEKTKLDIIGKKEDKSGSSENQATLFDE